MNDFEKALNYAFLLLKNRNRSEKEIYLKLKLKKYDENVIKDVINKLHSLKYLDDTKFAEEFVKYQLEKGKGIILIKNELVRKGIEKEIIEETIKNLKPSPESEYETAKQLFINKIKKFKDLPVNKIYSRLGGYLLRKGFSPDTVNKIFSEWKDELKELL